MSYLLLSVLTQSLTFLPLALGISISFHMLRATDMTLDGSFVLGAAIFAVLISEDYSVYFAIACVFLSGAFAGLLVALIQRNGKVDPLLAGVLATFILSSVNLIIMGKPNISLLSQTTLVSHAFTISEWYGWLVTFAYIFLICTVCIVLLLTQLGLNLRALGDNPQLFKRLGKKSEAYRMAGFALTNMLSAVSGCFTAQAIGYADVGMGFGMTLTGIGAIILGQQIIQNFTTRFIRIGSEFCACLIGVLIYFLALNALLQLDINPIYLKLILGIILIIFLRSAKLSFNAGRP